MVCTEPEVDILTLGHDVPKVAGSPIRRNSGETDGDGVALYYELQALYRHYRLSLIQ